MSTKGRGRGNGVMEKDSATFGQDLNMSNPSMDTTIGQNLDCASIANNSSDEDTCSIAAKIHDLVRQMLKGKSVLVGDDGLHVNAKLASEVFSKT